MRKFDTGATRNLDEGRIDPEAFLSPTVLESYSEYMNKNRLQADGTVRAGDNWQKGIPVDAYMKSIWRHFLDLWKAHRGYQTPHSQIENLNALLFNVMGMQFELLKAQEQEQRELQERIAIDAAMAARIENAKSPREEFVEGTYETEGPEEDRVETTKREFNAWRKLGRTYYSQTGEQNPPLRSLSPVERSKGVGVHSEWPTFKVESLASQVRSEGPSEAGVLGN